MMDGQLAAQLTPPPPPPVRPRRRGWLLPLAAAIAVLGLVVWGVLDRSRQLAALTTLAQQQSLLPVQVISPAAGPPTRMLDLPGTIDAWHSAPIYAQVSGYVHRWFKDYGATVHAGDVLATIATPGLDEQFAAAQADLAVARTRSTLADVTAKRWQSLSGSRAVSQEAIDAQTADAVAAAAHLIAVQHELARYQALEQFKTIVAPFDGIVSARNTDIGDYVNASGGDANAHATASASLFTVSDVHAVRVFVAVPQDYAGMLRPGLTATVSMPQYPGRRFAAAFSTTAQSFNPQSRTVVTELTIQNSDHAIWPGTYADVHFVITADTQRLILPEQALLFRAQGVQVALLDQAGRIHLQDVTLGLNLGETVQVTSGLSRTDRIVMNPSASLLEGARIRIVPGVPGIAPAPEFVPRSSIAAVKP